MTNTVSNHQRGRITVSREITFASQGKIISDERRDFLSLSAHPAQSFAPSYSHRKQEAGSLYRTAPSDTPRRRQGNFCCKNKTSLTMQMHWRIPFDHILDSKSLGSELPLVALLGSELHQTLSPWNRVVSCVGRPGEWSLAIHLLVEDLLHGN